MKSLCQCLTCRNVNADSKIITAKDNTARIFFLYRQFSKSSDIGDVISANTLLAKIYATDLVEVRLPIKNSELSFIDLPADSKQIRLTMLG